MNRTSIEWCDFSANPLKYRDAAGKVVWACVHASPGCQHCYAETLAKRFNKGGPFNVPTTATVTPFLDEKELHTMLTAKRIGGRDVSGSRVFVGDMTDVFGPWVSDDQLDHLFAVMALRSDVTWMVLTKRAERMHQYMTAGTECWRGITLARAEMIGETADNADWPGWPNHQVLDFGAEDDDDPGPVVLRHWPMPNVWLGVSAEDQQHADKRIPHLLHMPAAVRFVSAEPLIGPVDLTPYFFGPSDWNPNLQLHWVIPGGESGSGARPCDMAWVRSLVQQCRGAGTACFVKQLGANRVEDGCHDPGHTASLDRVRSRKGSDPTEWPKALRVRQFPRSEVPA